MDEVAAYFNERAGKWDENGCSGESRVQGAVLSLVDLKPGDSVLDLGCGTGVMIPFYLSAQAGKIVAVDVSEKMVERAREKFGNEPSVELRASDALSLDESERFDAVVIYNAYPTSSRRPHWSKKCIAWSRQKGVSSSPMDQAGTSSIATTRQLPRG